MSVSIKSPTSTTGSIQLNASDAITIDSSSNITVPNNLTVTGTSTLTGNVTASGDLAVTGTITAGSGLGGNAPYFFGALASDTTVTRNVWTKMTGMSTGEVDSDSAFDASTGRFTVPSGKGGDYVISASVRANYTGAGDDGETINMNIYINGVATIHSARFSMGGAGRTGTIWQIDGHGIITLSAGDYIELYVNLIDASGNNAYVNANTTHLMAYKIG